MPKRSERRVLLADTALALIDDYGLAQVTHRAIDAAAGVPIGTTSNYFPTRAALYEAIARRILDQQLEAEADTADGEATAEGVADYLAAAGDAGAGPARNRYLARFELSLEASRNADLAAVMRELRAVTVRRRAARIRAVYPEATEQQADAIASLLTGIAFDRLTLEVPAMDTAAIARAVLRGFLE
ncbi:TetR/AcrR family transcriptional regulator [Nocardia cyriacigeorgica]|uniref:TetR/AcrR family transcriptional regulator n=1 Tax=Nocardia cyriacigeorgica TaxID=135487 RepID=UPI001894724C|nr:TetR/AcrR family transcriptional regulator [Nocardia cyriacigeorgica]MBF6090460.1 TetR family transcriptional regulator [Nocardia cyriacigeorgica]